MALGPITSCQIDGLIMETVTDFIFLDSKITADDNSSHEIKRHLLLGRKTITNLAYFLLILLVSLYFSIGHVINYCYIIIAHLYRFLNFILPPQLECKLHEDRGFFCFIHRCLLKAQKDAWHKMLLSRF